MNNNDYKYCLYFKDKSKEPLTIMAKDLHLYEYLKENSKKPEAIKMNPNANIFIFNASFRNNKALLNGVIERKRLYSPRFKYTADDFDHVELIAEWWNSIKYGFETLKNSKKETYKEERVIPIIYGSDYIVLDRLLDQFGIDLENLRDFYNPDDMVLKISQMIINSSNKDNPFFRCVNDTLFSVAEKKYDDENKRLLKYDPFYADMSSIDKVNLYSLMDSDNLYVRYGKGSTFFFNILSLYTLYQRLYVMSLDKKEEFRYEVLNYIGSELVTSKLRYEVSYKSIQDLRDEYNINKDQNDEELSNELGVQRSRK